MMNLTEKEVAAEIAIREASALNRQSLQELAGLYIVQDHLFGQPQPYAGGYSQALPPQPTGGYAGEYGESDFLRAIAGKDLEALWSVMDELMDTLSVVNQKAYNSVMRKVTQI